MLPAPATPTASRSSAGAPVALLWEDVQTRFDATSSSTFMETEAKVQSGEGLAALGNVSLSWSPATDTLTVHRLRILREGKIIDLSPKDGAFTVLRREAKLDSEATLDGVLTAVVQPEGLQVGDVLDVAFTLRREDPLLRGRMDADLVGFDDAPTGRFRLRAVWPKGAGVSWRVGNGLDAPRLTERDGEVEARLEATDLQPLAKPQGAPLRFQFGRELTLSNYADWASVSALMAPLFEEAEHVSPGSAVATEARAIAAHTLDPTARAAAALALVQDKVRYLAQAIGDGGLKPQPAELTWARRYGDCKAKTALLLALLKALGVEAEPVLAASANGAGLDTRLPALSAFDHVLVRATIGGRDYWLDGTRLGDTSLSAIQTPDFGFVLPVRRQGAALMLLRPPPAAAPLGKILVRIDARGGIDKPAPFHAEADLRGDGGLEIKGGLASLSPEERDRVLRAYWRGKYDFVEVGNVSASFDPATGVERLTMDGSAKLDWSHGGYEVDGAAIGSRFDAHRDPGPNAAAPFNVGYPGYDLSEETILLPEQGRGFSIWGNNIDRQLAGYAFLRTASLKEGEFHILTSTRALAPEISLAQAQADAGPLTEMSKGAVRLRDPEQTAGIVADLKALREKQPTTRDGYLLRGATFLDDHRYADAERDFDKAVDIDPGSAAALAGRGLARVWQHKIVAAQADLDKAATIDPSNLVLWRARGLLAFKQGRFAEAAAMFTKALELSPGDYFSLTHRVDAYSELNNFPLALADIDAGLKVDPSSVEFHANRAAIFMQMSDRVGARAELKNIPVDPHAFHTTYSRARLLVWLGERKAALSEVDAAVKASPSADLYMLQASIREPSDVEGKKSDALAAYALQPDNREAVGTMAGLLFQAQDYAESLKWVDRAIALDPTNIGLQVDRTEARLKVSGDRDAAVREMAQERILGSADADVLNHICYFEATFGFDLSTALSDCDASLKLSPNWFPVLDSRAFVLLRMGRDSEAKLAYDKALAAAPKLADSLYGRGLVERRLGQTEAASADLKAAVAQSPGVAKKFADYGVTR